MSYKTIKEICSLIGCTESALRYYEEKGILCPTLKGETGRREWLYDDEAVSVLELIVLYRKIDSSVEDIRAILEEMKNHSSETLEKKLGKLKEERELLDKKITVAEMLVMIEHISEDTDEEIKRYLIEELLRLIH